MRRWRYASVVVLLPCYCYVDVAAIVIIVTSGCAVTLMPASAAHMPLMAAMPRVTLALARVDEMRVDNGHARVSYYVVGGERRLLR